MNDDIKQLTELQVIDLQIAELDQELTAQQAALATRKTSVEECRTVMEALRQKIVAAEARQRELDAGLSDELSRVKERQSKMMQVQTNREYQSILKEIEDGKRSNKDREDQIEQLMEQCEANKKILQEQDAKAAEDEKVLAEETSKVESLAAELESRKALVAKEREAKAKNVHASLLKKYDMLRARRNGKAVVAAAGGTCQGCFMNIPPQLYNEILKGDKMLACPTCQRILYSQPATEEK